jgi:hypothetical protein
MATALEIVITARDDATRVLQGVKSQLAIFDEFGRVASDLTEKTDGFTRATEAHAVSMTHSTRAVRELTGPLLYGLSPALGQTTSQLLFVVQGASQLGTGFGLLGIAAAGVAGVLTGVLLGAFNQVATAQAEFQKAVNAFDLSKIATETQKAIDKIDQLRQRGVWLEAIGSFESMTGQPPIAIPPNLTPEQRLAALARQRELAIQDQQLREGLALMGPAREADARRTFELEQQQRTLLDFQAARSIEAAYTETLRQARDLGISGQPAAAARLREAGAARRYFSYAGFLGRDATESGQGFEQAIAGAPDEVTRQAIAERQRLAGIEELRKSLEATVTGGQAEIIGQGVSPEDLAGGLTRNKQLMGEQAQLAAQLLELERKRLDFAGQLTPELSAQLTQLQAAAIASDERLSPEQKTLALAQAQLAVWQDLAALDPLGGLAAGFSRVATESRKLGTELERFATETAGNMQRSFSDLFFDSFTGQKGADIGKQFGEAMLRSFTDLLSRQLTGAVSGLFAQALRGFSGALGVAAGSAGGSGFDLLNLFTGGGSGGGAVLSPTGAPTGTLVMMPSGQLAQVTPTGGLQSGGIGLDTALGYLGSANQLYGTVSGSGQSLTTQLGITGGGYLQALGATPIASIGTSGLSAAVATTALGQSLGFYTASGGIVAGSSVAGGAAAGGLELASAGVSGGAYGAGATSAATLGYSGASTVGSVAAGVLAGAALAYTIYSGLSQEPTAQNMAMNAVSGALSGAVLGTMIFPGIGTVVGAVAGGLAGAFTTGLKYNGKKLSADERSRMVGEAAAGNLSSAIDQAGSIEDLVTIFNTRWAPHGEVQIVTTYQGLYYWAGDWDDPAANLATTQLMIIPEFLDALDIQVGSTGTPARRQDLVDKFRGKRDQLLEALSNVPIEVIESDRAAGITRRSYMPFTQIYGMKPGTQQIVSSSELLRRDLGADDETIAFLIQRIREVSVRKDVDISRQDFLFR